MFLWDAVCSSNDLNQGIRRKYQDPYWTAWAFILYSYPGSCHTWIVEWKQCKRPACKLETWSRADAAQGKIWLVLNTGSQSVDSVAPEWTFPFTVNGTVERVLRSSKASSNPALPFLGGDFFYVFTFQVLQYFYQLHIFTKQIKSL